MSRFFYQTEGLIIGSRDWGEADQLLSVVTPDHGLVKIMVKGTRSAKSKLRFNLQLWRPVNLTLVRGNEVWRLVGAELVPGEPKLGLTNYRLLSRVGILLARFVPAEAEAKKLYLYLREVLKFLAQEPLNEDKLNLVELILVAKILAVLGYVSIQKALPFGLSQEAWTEQLLDQVKPKRQQMIGLINQAITASQL